MRPWLELAGITKSFGAVQALRGVSFDLYPGEVHALLGENGAGKSTLIKIVTGALQPDGGTIALGGQSVMPLNPSRAHASGVACIYQQPALFPDLSVAENLALRWEPVAPFRRIDWRARRERAQALLRRVGTELDPDTEVRALSMPEQQLVEIAAAVGAGARVVIMDEPTASLTRREQERLFAVVRELRAGGTGIIYISHRLEEIFALADRVTVLRDGASVGTRQVRPISPRSSGETPAADESGEFLSETTLIQMMVGREVRLERCARQRIPGEPVLSVRRLHCRRSGIHTIDFEVRSGEILGFAGLVGAGRTELARTLFGITPADHGEILLRGEKVSVTSPAAAVALGLAYVPEDRRRHGVIQEMSVAANISLALHRRLFPGTWLRRGAERRLAERMVAQFAIKVTGVDTPVSSLSGGNQQKVALARWLATEPSVLILDEPTQGVDVGAKAEIHRWIRDQADAGLAVILISSDLPEVLALSDRLLVMRGGTVVAEFPGGAEGAEVMAAALGQGNGSVAPATSELGREAMDA